MSTITRDGVTLAYEEQGQGDPPYVFVHGWTCDRSYFAPQVEHFSPRHRCLSVDLRGHGQSDKPEGEYPIADYADDVAYLVEKLGLDRPIAVGHSMGGITVLQLAASHPDKVRGIVMVDPAPLVFPPELRGPVEAIVAAIEAGDNGPRRQFIEQALFLPQSPAELRSRVADEMVSAPSHVAAAAMRGILAFDGPRVAATCRVPALHIAATPPLNPPHLLSEWMPDVVHGWTVGAGHFNQLEAADQVNSMIEAFARHYAGAAG
jgi:pimeloyl-ACP methyl ester carboxylesterase